MMEGEFDVFAFSNLTGDSLKPFSASATSYDSLGPQNKGLLLNTRTCT
jgi:hypothetical protein